MKKITRKKAKASSFNVSRAYSISSAGYLTHLIQGITFGRSWLFAGAHNPDRDIPSTKRFKPSDPVHLQKLDSETFDAGEAFTFGFAEDEVPQWTLVTLKVSHRALRVASPLMLHACMLTDG